MRGLWEIVTVWCGTEKLLIGPRLAFAGSGRLNFLATEHDVLSRLQAIVEDPADLALLRRTADRWFLDDGRANQRSDETFIRDIAHACVWGGLGAVAMPDVTPRFVPNARLKAKAVANPKAVGKAPSQPASSPQES